MCRVPVFVLLALAGCSSGDGGNSVDLSAAATAATADIGNYAVVAGRSTDERTAGDVVRGFAAAIADRRWPAVRAALRDDENGVAIVALRRRYDRFVTRVGRVEAIDRDRRMTVPVEIVASPRSGTQDLYDGEVRLVPGPVDGPPWLIESIELSPPLPASATAVYDCADRTKVSVRFDNLASTAVATSGRSAWRMVQQRAASGIAYEGGGAVLRGKGQDAEWSVPERRITSCRAR